MADFLEEQAKRLYGLGELEAEALEVPWEGEQHVAGRSGDRDNPFVPNASLGMRAFERDPSRGGHFGQRSCEPR